MLQGLEFTDQDGQRLEASSLADRPILLHFMFTSCPVACPRAVSLLGRTRAELPPDVRDRLAIVSVSVDPENDTPRALREFAKREGALDPAWRFLRPSPLALERLSERLTVFEPDAPEIPSQHSLTIYLFDKKGRPLQRYGAADVEAKHLAREIVALDRVDPSRAPDPQI